MGTIQQLATSYSGSILAAAEGATIVHLWDLRKRRRLRTLETIYDFGGRRLAISPDGKTLVAGAYLVHGIAAYRSADGTLLWQRRDLKKVQSVVFSADGAHALCHFEGRPSRSLRARDGKASLPMRGVRNVWCSPFSALTAQERGNGYDLVERGRVRARIEALTFAALDLAFSEEAVCVSESGGPVRALSLDTGEEWWRYEPREGTHCLKVAWSASAGSFVGIRWPYQKGGSHDLVVFDGRGGGRVVARLGPQRHRFAFCLEGSALACGSGELFSVPSGKLLGQIALP